MPKPFLISQLTPQSKSNTLQLPNLVHPLSPMDDHDSSFTYIHTDFIDQTLDDSFWFQSTNGFKSLQQPPIQDHHPTADNDPISTSNGQNSLRERLIKAIYHFQTLAKDRNVLIQIWVPVKRGLKSFLTTAEQPFSYDPSCSSLVSFRNVSESYQFSADEDSKEGLGLPGRVFRRRSPEWTPDVRLFRQDEYPRVSYAQMCDVRGSIALPVFEKGSGMCLGVVEIVTTSLKITCRPEVETVCKALEAVDLRSSEILGPSRERKCGSELQRPELSEILHIIRAICDTHGLPLGQTWTTADNNAHCASTIDVACYVRDPKVLGFHQACSEQELVGSQGVVGKAFMTNQPCYAIDVTEHSKSEYPLSHHAKMFRLQGAVAVHLQCLYDPSRSYALEFFLPIDCQDPCLALHFRIMESLTRMVKDSQGLCFFLADKEVQLEPTLSKRPSQSDTSWISSLVEAQQKGKEVGLSFEFGKESRDEFRVTTHWGEANVETEKGGMITEYGGMNQDFRDIGFMESLGCSSFGSDYSLGAPKAGEKRRTKAQKTISLDVLRQYFAGSLKDAARSIGVCPTTLKRICRQHGINRWPSRKIKKVGHSLKKLQLVIDSVQGAQGSIKLSSFYSEFPQLSPTDAKINHQTNPSGGTTSRSNSSSQTSTSSHSFSTEPKASPITPNSSTSQDQGRSSKRARSEAEPPAPSHIPPARRGGTGCKVKATFGEEMVRLTLTPDMGFEALRGEIAKRFGVGDLSKMYIKYLDDDEEWVLLTCDDDLEECIDIQRTNGSQNVKLSVHQVSARLGGSLGQS